MQKSKYVLGLCAFKTQSAVALLKDGKPVYAAAEERFSRKKNDTPFPEQAFSSCLEENFLSVDDIDTIAFVPSVDNDIEACIRERLGYRSDVFKAEHILAHAASAFLLSPFDKAAIAVMDDSDAGITTSYGIGEGHRLRNLMQVEKPHSIGLFYSALTQFLGFKPRYSEFKVMGLASYGKKERATNPYYDKLKRTVKLREGGKIELDLSYFNDAKEGMLYSDKLGKLLKLKPRLGRIDAKHKDLALALQMFAEDMIFHVLRAAHSATACDNMVIAGNVALNSVANGKIIRKTAFKKIWIQPAAGDSGLALGAACLAYADIAKKRPEMMADDFLGPSFGDRDIMKFLEKKQVEYEHLADERELVKEVAKAIGEGKIVGWFQGKMEFGPRALGNRSVLADPHNPDAKDILNKRIKHREAFRPFAPAVCIEDAKELFDCDMPPQKPTDFMLMVYPIKEKYRKRVPAVTHVDGSGRLQTVRKADNPLFHSLIKEFGRLSGIPMLLNTSFNSSDEPIVCTPADAYDCFKRTGMDYLVMGRFLIRK